MSRESLIEAFEQSCWSEERRQGAEQCPKDYIGPPIYVSDERATRWGVDYPKELIPGCIKQSEELMAGTAKVLDTYLEEARATAHDSQGQWAATDVGEAFRATAVPGVLVDLSVPLRRTTREIARRRFASLVAVTESGPLAEVAEAWGRAVNAYDWHSWLWLMVPRVRALSLPPETYMLLVTGHWRYISLHQEMGGVYDRHWRTAALSHSLFMPALGMDFAQAKVHLSQLIEGLENSGRAHSATFWKAKHLLSYLDGASLNRFAPMPLVLDLDLALYLPKPVEKK